MDIWEWREKNRRDQLLTRIAIARKRRLENPDAIRQAIKKKSSPSKAAVRQKKYRQRVKEKEKAVEIREIKHVPYGTNTTPEQRKAASVRYAYRMKNDIQFKIANNLRRRIKDATRGIYKSGSAVSDLGCSIQEFRSYLESLFKPGMEWGNWGRAGWHLDHIQPLSSFDLTDRAQFLKACHYTNMQPLWASDNMIKGKKKKPH